VVDLYSHCMHGTLSQCIRSEVLPPLNPTLLSRGQSPLKLKNIYQINTNFNISKHWRNSLWSFSPASELRIISQRHVDRCKVFSTSTDDCRLSLSLNVLLCAQHNGDSLWGSASHSLLVSAKTCSSQW